MSDSEESFQMLEVIDEKIKNYIAKNNEFAQLENNKFKQEHPKLLPRIRQISQKANKPCWVLVWICRILRGLQREARRMRNCF